MNEIRLSQQDVNEILERHRQNSEREHMKFLGVGFLIGMAVVGMIWGLL